MEEGKIPPGASSLTGDALLRVREQRIFMDIYQGTKISPGTTKLDSRGRVDGRGVWLWLGVG